MTRSLSPAQDQLDAEDMRPPSPSEISRILSRLTHIDPDWEAKILKLVELHEKGGLNKINPWDGVVGISHRVVDINDILLETGSRPHLELARRFCFAVVGLHQSRVTTLHDDVLKSIGSLIAVTNKGNGEAGEKVGRAKRTRKADDGDCPTNAQPQDISLPESDCVDGIGRPLFHSYEAGGDGNKIASMHLFNLPCYGGADLGYDLMADPGQLVAEYEEAFGAEPPRIDALLPVLRAAAKAPLEVEALDDWLPEPGEGEVAAHDELAALIVAEGERQLRAIEQGWPLEAAGAQHGSAAPMGAAGSEGAHIGTPVHASADVDGALADAMHDMHVHDDGGGAGYDYGDAGDDVGDDWGGGEMSFNDMGGFDAADDDFTGRASAGADAGTSAAERPQAAGEAGDVRSELGWLLQGGPQQQPLSWAQPNYWRYHATPGERKDPAEKSARKAAAPRTQAAVPPPESLDDPRFALATRSTRMSEATRQKRAARCCALAPSYGLAYGDSLFLLGKTSCRVEDAFADLHKECAPLHEVERRPRLAKEVSAMHDGGGFGDVWAEDRIDDGGDDWDGGGGDFAGYAAFEPGGSDGEDAAYPSAAGGGSAWTEPEEGLGAGGLTPLVGGLVQAPKQRRRMKAKFDLSSKHVDVHAVKNALWDSYVHIESESCSVAPPALGGPSSSGGAASETTVGSRGVELKAIFEDAPCSHPTPLQATMEKASVHVKFICMLHIANEKDLQLEGVPTMDKVHISRCQTA